ncbi:MAG TPA: hypothetical protein VKZ60_04630 [Chloroflexota bacterium]|jgi:predicted RNA-binding Zn-ribbon protein involved in translation (DUF1610 family)|nr:hypothetical protein [Chloroflexota bacterium]
MTCQGCGTLMAPQPPKEMATEEGVSKWKCPRCGSWCFAQDDEVIMGAWLLEGPGWPQ